jgi:uncharacterized repeat protein (TIGR01451 family)
MAVAGVFLAMGLIPVAATGQATSGNLKVKTIAEVETHSVQQGRPVVRLVQADRVVPGDEVIYTVEIRNVGKSAVRSPTVSNPIPAHMRYVADSATGPGVEVRYSVDGGHEFDFPENLKVIDADGRKTRAARADDYTDIRWTFRHALESKSVAFAHFRAVVR